MDFKIYNPGNTRPHGKRLSTECIILHHAAAIKCTPADIIRWHKERGFNGAGYNWFIAKDGTKYQLRPIWASGAHTIGFNSRSIGICAEGNFELEEMPEVQRKSIAEVIDYCNDYYHAKFPVYGHKNKWSTACPGKNYPFAQIVDLAAHWDDKPVIPYPGHALRYNPKVIMRGNNVRAIQQRLNELGFNCGRTDGSFGPKTLASVKAFQKARGLVGDGSVGPATWKALFN